MKLLFSVCFLIACTSADKTAGGALLGAGWGAGTGAIVGHKIASSSQDGAVVGAGLGLVEGAMTGAGLDVAENKLADTDAELEELKIQNLANSKQIADVQNKLDYPIQNTNLNTINYIKFDIGSSKILKGNLEILKILANEIKKDGSIKKIKLLGHADDSGDRDLNLKLSLDRAQNVFNILKNNGISQHVLEIQGNGEEAPSLSNMTPEGRSENRRVEIIIIR